MLTRNAQFPSSDAQVVVLSSLSLGGNIIPVENLAESLQVAFDARAKRVLSMASMSGIPTIPGELFAKFKTSFYTDATDAVFKPFGAD